MSIEWTWIYTIGSVISQGWCWRCSKHFLFFSVVHHPWSVSNNMLYTYLWDHEEIIAIHKQLPILYLSQKKSFALTSKALSFLFNHCIVFFSGSGYPWIMLSTMSLRRRGYRQRSWWFTQYQLTKRVTYYGILLHWLVSWATIIKSFIIMGVDAYW